MIRHKLPENLAAILGQIPGIIQARTRAELYPLQLPELAVDLPRLSVMPEHCEQIMSLTNVETVEIHGNQAILAVLRTCIRDRYAESGRKGSIRGLDQPDGALPDRSTVPTVPGVAI